MWEWHHKEGRASKNLCFWTVMLERTLESPWDCLDIKQVHLKGNQLWILTGRTDGKAPILWPPDVNWLFMKDSDAAKDWKQQEKGTAEDEMVGWHHQLEGHELEQAPGVGDGQGSLACCSPWGHKKSDTAEWLNKNNPTELLWEILKTFSAHSESGCFWQQVTDTQFQQQKLQFQHWHSRNRLTKMD